MNYQFKPQYQPTEIPDRAKEYKKKREKNGKTGAQEDRRMERAGRCLVNRPFRFACVVMIVLWKSHRPMWLFVQNKRSDVEAAIKAAIAATHAGDVRRAVTSLTTLNGVGLKMASAILTAMFPTLYTVCDFRASEALGQRDYSSLRYYVAYLDYCRRMAAQYGVTLRDFDRANWQWSWEQAQKVRPLHGVITKNRKRPCRKPSMGNHRRKQRSLRSRTVQFRLHIRLHNQPTDWPKGGL